MSPGDMGARGLKGSKGEGYRGPPGPPGQPGMLKGPPILKCLFPLSIFMELQLFQQPNHSVLTSELSDLCMSALLTKIHQGCLSSYIFNKSVGVPCLYLIFKVYFY